MNDQTVLEIVYLLGVVIAFSLVWARLVWAIRRGDRWKKTAEYRDHYISSLDRGNRILLAELQTAKKHRDELREHIDLSEESDGYEWPEEEPPF